MSHTSMGLGGGRALLSVLFIALLGVGPAFQVRAQHELRPNKPPRDMFVELLVERARHTRGGSWEGSDRSQDIKLTITLNNRNTSRDYKDLTGYCYVVAQDVEDKKRFKLIIKESESLNLMSGQKIQHESSEVHLEFWRYSGDGYGFKYYGHVYVLQDKQGKVLVGMASPDELWQKLDKLANTELKDEFKF